ncbi:hypothetical protein PPYC1_20925 [Paenibacillus polymyxa]|nr:hypothetical protein PPYC1_20925 [Paenibacillus polymyxa]OMF48482.1 hypothetical protein BK135_09260 [Paenibacillus peoriae]
MAHSLILMLLKSVRHKALIQVCLLFQDKAVVRAAVKVVDRIGLLMVKAAVKAVGRSGGLNMVKAAVRVVGRSGGLNMVKVAVRAVGRSGGLNMVKVVDHSGLPVDLVALIGKIGKTNIPPLL